MHHGTAPLAARPAPDGSVLDTVQVVARTPALAEVRIYLDDGEATSIGAVRLTHDAWGWEHNDGEHSSPIAATRLEAARALADYHRKYKPLPARRSLRQRLDEARVR